MICFEVFEAPKSASRRIEDYGKEDEFGAKDFSKELVLKADHQNRPLWIVRELKFYNLSFFLCYYSCCNVSKIEKIRINKEYA